ncbi:hypothetical protein AK812_SmicGene7579 [Symbiodinium microadriaticum]|uniref:Uncharacterized protein n=1 Tax=Symbiodinium microadriaticum TaxID=2951 RepID=A0A1Q9ENA6_SYMMI|nr:hypothetical protein AK812_SmicGene7579 [Symbiodinium microadriaticum]
MFLASVVGLCNSEISMLTLLYRCLPHYEELIIRLKAFTEAMTLVRFPKNHDILQAMTLVRFPKNHDILQAEMTFGGFPKKHDILQAQLLFLATSAVEHTAGRVRGKLLWNTGQHAMCLADDSKARLSVTARAVSPTPLAVWNHGLQGVRLPQRRCDNTLAGGALDFACNSGPDLPECPKHLQTSRIDLFSPMCANGICDIWVPGTSAVAYVDSHHINMRLSFD